MVAQSRTDFGDDDNGYEGGTIPAMLLQQKAETLSDNVLLYNVYYNTEIDPNETPTNELANLKSESKKNQASENLVRIDIDVNELKRYTGITPQSSRDLQNLANEITKSIQIDQNGDIIVNSAKLNPNAVNVVERSLNLNKFDEKKLDDNKSTEKRKVLFKNTKAYGERKYLLIITYIERLSNVNKIILAHQGDDQVYEEFELFIEISGLCLSNPSIKPLLWELSLPECQRITGEGDVHEIAKFFANHINIFGEQFLLSTPLKINMRYKGVTILNEKLIRILQNKFRTRKFLKNFNAFKDQMKNLSGKVLARAVINTGNDHYQVLAYEKTDLLAIEAWDILNYRRYELLLDSKLLEKYLKFDKERTVKKIFLFLGFETNKNKQYTLVIREKQLMETLSKEFYF
jgi:hypothetical protein